MLTIDESSYSGYSKQSRKPLVFIDSRVSDLEQLVADLTPTTHVHVLPPNDDGVNQITARLKHQPDVESIHILSHGKPGCLYLGNAELSLWTLAKYEHHLKAWNFYGSKYSSRPSLLLYGCHLALGQAGSKFLQQVYRLTGLPLYASTSKIGSIIEGGQWQLEVAIGTHQQPPDRPISQEMEAQYSGTFAAQLIKDINPSSDTYPSPYGLLEAQGKLFFTADDGVNGRELWVSDGTEAGTTLVRDITPGRDPYDSAPYNFVEVGGQIFFTADDGVNGRELWISDGTEAGTTLIKNISPGDGVYGTPYNLIEFGGRLFFTADDGISGRELWVSDGTEAGTTIFKDINPNSPGDDRSNGPNNFIVVNDQLFFVADDGASGRELWVSDGTEAGTTLIKDINPGTNPFYNPSPRDFINVNDRLFFTADNGVNGRELWVSDGTEAGTTLVKDINPDNASSNLGLFVAVGERLFFAADNGTNGRELWVSDGTESGTTLVKDINPNSANTPPLSDLTVVGERLFFIASNGVNGRELWVSDGTEAGTTLVKDINPSSDNFYPAPETLTGVGDRLFFTANDGVNGRELWVSDGTKAGTTLVKNIGPGDDDFDPSPEDLLAVGDLLFFTADDGLTGRELWLSDGTEVGTISIADINPGESGSSPSMFTVIDNQLIFTANDGKTGEELWVTSIPTNIISGDDQDNNLRGTSENNIINGGSGNDVIRARQGDDIVNGGNDDDTIFGSRGSDVLNGDNGDDALSGGLNNDSLNGGSGQDRLVGAQGNDTLKGGPGNNSLEGGSGRDTADFSNMNTSVNANLGTGVASSEATPGNLEVSNLIAIENLVGSSFDDSLVGNSRANLLAGLNGDDLLIGQRGRDTLLGGDDRDELRGEEGQDSLNGGEDNDILLGGQGADILVGDEGSDVLIGGGGADIFKFGDHLFDGLEDVDTIQDFQSQDSFDFDDFLGSVGTLSFTRVTPTLIQIEINIRNHMINVFGTNNSLDVAEEQLTQLL